MSPSRSIGANRALYWVELAVRVDEPLEPMPEASVRRPEHRLGAVEGMGGQAANLAPAPLRFNVTHSPTMPRGGRCRVGLRSAVETLGEPFAHGRFRGRPVEFELQYPHNRG